MQERELCAATRILPAQYLAVKGGLLAADGQAAAPPASRLLDKQRLGMVVELMQVPAAWPAVPCALHCTDWAASACPAIFVS